MSVDLRNYITGCPEVDDYCMARPVGTDEELTIFSLLDQGLSYADIEQKLSRSRHTIRNIAHRRGLVSRPGGRPPRVNLDEAEVVKMWEDGATMTSIVRSCHSSVGRVAKVLRAAGHDPSHQMARRISNNWKGGRIRIGDYVAVRIYDDDPYFCMAQHWGYVLEHRLVMARKLGRPLTPLETVHHLDGNGLNNSEDNLQVRSRPHGKGIVLRCHDCGSCNVGPVPLSGD